VHNLRADPHAEIQIGRERHPATAEILTEGADYERGWKIMNELNRFKDGGRYEHYQSLTTRRIPVVALTT
jgi:deazaflavin-dependent oxidoreductase (nitroreductase family)